MFLMLITFICRSVLRSLQCNGLLWGRGMEGDVIGVKGFF